MLHIYFKSEDDIFNTVMKNPNSLIVVDGAAFGFNLEDVIPLLQKYNCFLIAKESFEYYNTKQ